MAVAQVAMRAGLACAALQHEASSVVPLATGAFARQRSLRWEPAMPAGLRDQHQRSRTVQAASSVQVRPDEASTANLADESTPSLTNYTAARVVDSRELVPGVRIVTLEAEISREFVPLSSAYTLPGQLASVRLPSGSDEHLPIASPPFSFATNYRVLDKLRGDIFAGQTKVAQETMSVKAPLELYVDQQQHPEFFDVKPGAEVQLGPYTKNGLTLRPILALTRYPTVLVFARGAGAAVARALLDAVDTGSLNLRHREQTRLFLAASAPNTVPFQECFPTWEARKVDVRVTVDSAADLPWEGHVGSLQELFDADDLEYDAECTAVVALGDEALVAEVTELAREGGIPDAAIVRWHL